MLERCDNVALETQINNVVTMQAQLSKIGVRKDHKNKSDVLLTLCREDSEKRNCINRIWGNKKDDFCRYTKHESARERRGAESERKEQAENISHTHTHTLTHTHTHTHTQGECERELRIVRWQVALMT